MHKEKYNFIGDMTNLFNKIKEYRGHLNIYFDKPEDKDDPKPEFNKKKRYPGKDKKTGKPFPGVNGCAMIPLYIFKDEEEDVEEIVDIEDEKDIV